MKKNKLVAIDLDRVRHLRFGAADMEEIERISGKPIQKMQDGFFGDMVTMIFAGLKWEDVSLTREQVLDMIDEYGMQLFADKVGEAMSLTFGENGTPSN